jgi:hypothetical protein
VTRWGRVVLAVVVLLVLAVAVARTAPRVTPTSPAAEATATGAPAPSVPTVAPVVTKTAGCQYRTAATGVLLPDPACTPGEANPALTRGVLCAPGFRTRAYRHVTEAQKRAAYARYGVVSHAASEYEVDHLIALEDGGANSDANLWPEPAPGYHEKDVVETWVHRQVCAGALDLAQAQRMIAADWTMLLSAARAADLPPKAHGPDDEEEED